jgi:hypothetical protein
MTKKLHLLLCFVSAFTFANYASACSNCVQHDALNESNNKAIHSSTQLSGYTCIPYKYTSEDNLKQTLGYLKSKNSQMINQNQDISPIEVFDNAESETDETKVIPNVTKSHKAKPTTKHIKASKSPKKKKQDDLTSTQYKPEPIPSVQKEAIVEQPTFDEVQTNKSSSIKEDLKPSTPTHLEEKHSESKAPEMNIAKEAVIKPTTSNSILRMSELNYINTEVDLSTTNLEILNTIVADMKSNTNLIAKINSFSSVKNGTIPEARRIALQRAIQIRKRLIENDISPLRITINSTENQDNTANKVEIILD